MRKVVQLGFSVLLLSFLFGSCKKGNEPQPIVNQVDFSSTKIDAMRAEDIPSEFTDSIATDSLTMTRDQDLISWSYAATVDIVDCAVSPGGRYTRHGRMCTGTWDVKTTLFPKDKALSFQVVLPNRGRDALNSRMDEHPGLFNGAKFEDFKDTTGSEAQIR